MISMASVPSALILRNASWVRRQAHALGRRVPSNVEQADLIQVGLIAVAQAALGFECDGDHDSEEAESAFVRYAQKRVRGAMLDELRQMDTLSRGQRRKVKVLEVARERWRNSHDRSATAADIGLLCGFSVEEVFALDLAASGSRPVSWPAPGDADESISRHEPATAHDEVEARVDTGMLMLRLEKLFAALPVRERQVIDTCLGIGLSPVELAESLDISVSRVSQLFKAIVRRIGTALGQSPQRSIDGTADHRPLGDLIHERERALAVTQADWGKPLEMAFALSDSDLVRVNSAARWG
jgi:RNA polymerase sigma factor for flagellar operon FliA